MEIPNDMSHDILLAWLRDQLAKAEQSLNARKQMESCWHGGTDATWKAVGCKLTKAQRLQESKLHGRIGLKCQRDVEMLKAIIIAIQK